MRYYWPWLFALLLSGCIIGSAYNISEKDLVGKANLLSNGDFEQVPQPSGQVPVGWMGLGVEDRPVVVRADSTQRIGGHYSLCVPGSEGKALLYSDDFIVQPRSVYYCCLWVRSLGSGQRPVTLKLVTFDDFGNTVDQAYYRHVPGKSWFRMELNTGFFKKTVVAARLVVELPAGETESFWLDDAGVFQVYQAPNNKP
jgi:hypothetical protein